VQCAAYSRTARRLNIQQPDVAHGEKGQTRRQGQEKGQDRQICKQNQSRRFSNSCRGMVQCRQMAWLRLLRSSSRRLCTSNLSVLDSIRVYSRGQRTGARAHCLIKQGIISMIMCSIVCALRCSFALLSRMRQLYS
jgi:hypothetical protein